MAIINERGGLMFSKGFTPKQRIFITEYLVNKNAAKAARLAGYSAKTSRSAGWRLLTNVDIASAIEKGLREQLERADITSDDILLTLKRITFADYGISTGKLRALELLGKSLGLFQNMPKVQTREFAASVLLGPGNEVLKSF